MTRQRDERGTTSLTELMVALMLMVVIFVMVTISFAIASSTTGVFVSQQRAAQQGQVQLQQAITLLHQGQALYGCYDPEAYKATTTDTSTIYNEYPYPFVTSAITHPTTPKQPTIALIDPYNPSAASLTLVGINGSSLSGIAKQCYSPQQFWPTISVIKSASTSATGGFCFFNHPASALYPAPHDTCLAVTVKTTQGTKYRVLEQTTWLPLPNNKYPGGSQVPTTYTSCNPLYCYTENPHTIQIITPTMQCFPASDSYCVTTVLGRTKSPTNCHSTCAPFTFYTRNDNPITSTGKPRVVVSPATAVSTVKIQIAISTREKINAVPGNATCGDGFYCLSTVVSISSNSSTSGGNIP